MRRNAIANKNLTVKQINLNYLANSINERLGIGEAGAIALATELQSDYVILDDFAARREAMQLGLNVKGTLAMIKKMIEDGKIEIDNLEHFHQQLLQIGFQVKLSILK